MRFAILFLFIFPVVSLAYDLDKVSIAPSPTKNEISVKIENKQDVTVKILTESGEVVWTEHQTKSEFMLDLEYYPKGVYYVQISIQDKVEIFKFDKR